MILHDTPFYIHTFTNIPASPSLRPSNPWETLHSRANVSSPRSKPIQSTAGTREARIDALQKRCINFSCKKTRLLLPQSHIHIVLGCTLRTTLHRFASLASNSLGISWDIHSSRRGSRFLALWNQHIDLHSLDRSIDTALVAASIWSLRGILCALNLLAVAAVLSWSSISHTCMYLPYLTVFLFSFVEIKMDRSHQSASDAGYAGYSVLWISWVSWSKSSGTDLWPDLNKHIQHILAKTLLWVMSQQESSQNTSAICRYDAIWSDVYIVWLCEYYMFIFFWCL
jgi:hypothetical protein